MEIVHIPVTLFVYQPRVEIKKEKTDG